MWCTSWLILIKISLPFSSLFQYTSFRSLFYLSNGKMKTWITSEPDYDVDDEWESVDFKKRRRNPKVSNRMDENFRLWSWTEDCKVDRGSEGWKDGIKWAGENEWMEWNESMERKNSWQFQGSVFFRTLFPASLESLMSFVHSFLMDEVDGWTISSQCSQSIVPRDEKNEIPFIPFFIFSLSLLSPSNPLRQKGSA